MAEMSSRDSDNVPRGAADRPNRSSVTVVAVPKVTNRNVSLVEEKEREGGRGRLIERSHVDWARGSESTNIPEEFIYDSKLDMKM